MIRWRLFLAAVLLPIIAAPLAAPIGHLIRDPSGWRIRSQTDRLLSLAGNTFALTTGTLALVMPVGVAAAVLLYRTDLPLRRFWRFLVIMTLFVPLPLFVSGWQTVLGAGGWLPLSAWSGSASVWTPWGQGIGSAVWIHAAAALPWVILLVGQGLSWVERECEEDALTLLPAWQVVIRVSLRRAGAAVGAAALWVGLQTATEISVTDVMQVRTFAEEVYTQLSGGPGVGESVAPAVAANMPFVLLVALLVGGAAKFWSRRLPARSTLVTPPLIFRLGRWRWPLTAAAALGAILLLVPLGSLVWRAGLVGRPPVWSATSLGHYLVRSARPPGGMLLLDSLLLAAGSGVLAAVLGLLACWAARGSGWFRGGVLMLMAVAWAMPGPLVGLGLKDIIRVVLDATDSRFLAHALYHGPSPLPLLWVNQIRFFPFAVAVLWPVMRLLPDELHAAARIDGATSKQELRYIVWPLTAAAFGRAALAVAVLSLGELSAGKLLATPGMPSYATEIFTQMHYGVTNELAARSLLLLLAASLGGVVLAIRGERANKPC